VIPAAEGGGLDPFALLAPADDVEAVRVLDGRE
jgi:hypothetical protein